MLAKFTCALGAALILAAAPAWCRGHVSVGIGLGFPILPPPIFYGPPVYYPPPIIYPPPTPPPPVYYAPAPAAAVPPPPPRARAEGQQCREYRSTSMIDGAPQQINGTACRQPDGSWRIVR